MSITESTTGATVYYTADGSQPTTASTVYTGPFTITTTATVNAMAAGPGLLQSPVASATYALVTQVAKPTFTPAPGVYTTARSVTISTTTQNASIFYTTDGTTPGTSVGGSTQQVSGPVSVGATETLKAIATASNLNDSPVASGLYTIDLGGISINFGSGFTAGSLTLNGGAAINGTLLRLTDGGGSEGRSAFFNTPMNVQSFVNDFSFQLTNANADGFTFTIQAVGSTALGSRGGGLGYTGIGKSVAVGFQLYSSVLGNKEVSLTGDWTNGAAPDAPPPASDTTGSGVNLRSGHVMSVHMTHDGTTLTWTITDTATGKTFTKSVTINIPALTGNTAYVGFTGGDGGLTAVQDILTWTYNQ